MSFDLNSLNQFLIACGVFAGLGFIGMFVFRGASADVAPEVTVSSLGPNEIIVQAGDYETTYSLKRYLDEPMLVTTITPQRRRTNPLQDYNSQFVTFSPKATRKYMTKYAGETHCPAGFMNRNADHITLYAGTTKIAQKLASWKQPDGSKVSNWDVVNISGKCLGDRTKILKNGEDVTDSTRLFTMGRKASRDCHMIYVTAIEPADLSVVEYARGAS